MLKSQRIEIHEINIIDILSVHIIMSIINLPSEKKHKKVLKVLNNTLVELVLALNLEVKKNKSPTFKSPPLN